jgi:hypothetical protein
MEIGVVRQQQRMAHDAIGRCHLRSPKKLAHNAKKPERVETITTTREPALVG